MLPGRKGRNSVFVDTKFQHAKSSVIPHFNMSPDYKSRSSAFVDSQTQFTKSIDLLNSEMSQDNSDTNSVKSKRFSITSERSHKTKYNAFMDKAMLDMESNAAEEQMEKKWNSYLECDNLPTSLRGADIRAYFENAWTLEEEDVERTIDYLLNLDDRSALQQDLDRIDCTRRNLEQTVRPEFGLQYNNHINKALEILERIEFLYDEEKSSPKAQLDYKEQKKFVQHEICNYFDRYTYRIISFEESYMNLVDVRKSEYVYSGDKFRMHIWAIRDLPIRFKYLEEKITCIMHEIGVVVDMPFHVLEDNLTIRGVLTNFDHFTQYAKSYEPEIPSDLPNFNVDFADQSFSEDLKRPRKKRKRTGGEKKKQKNPMKEQKQLLQYEKKTSKKGHKNKSKPETEINEQQYLHPNPFPDERRENLEDERNERFIKHIYNPRNLKLTEHEVNLRNHVILGGIYKLEFLNKPQHIFYGKRLFNMTFHEKNRELQTRTGIFADCDNINLEKKTIILPKSTRSTQDINIHLEEQPHLFPTTTKTNEDENDMIIARDITAAYGKCFEITFELPKFLCVWGEPIACHFENDVETISTQESAPGELISTILGTRATASPGSQIPAGRRATVIVTPPPSLSVDQSKTPISPPQSTIAQPTQTIELVRYPIEDFSFNFPLALNQSRKIEQYCVPRIISSFNFPQITNTDRNNENILYDEQYFIHETQNSPERLFPLFDTQSVQFSYPITAYHNIALELKYHPKTFYELCNILRMLHRDYKWDIEKIIKMPIYQPKIDIPKNSILNKEKSKYDPEKPLFKPKKRTHKRGSSQEMIGEDDKAAQTYSHWTREHVQKTHFEKEKHRITIWTNRLGIMGFAVKRYAHFPFRYWSVSRNVESPEREIVVTILTPYVKCLLFVTNRGYRAEVTELTEKYTTRPIKYLTIDDPIVGLKDLKQRFCENNLNIFAEPDARFYIEQGYFSIKHRSTEMHTYSCIALHARDVIFAYSEYNRLANRRSVILKFSNNKQVEEDDLLTVHITPEDTTFVELRELCNLNLDVDKIKLQYKPTWRNLEFFADLHQAVNSIYPLTDEKVFEDSKLMAFLNNLLSELRILSYS